MTNPVVETRGIMMNRKTFFHAIPILAVMIFGCELISPKSHVTPISNTSLLVYDKCQIEHYVGNEILEIKAGRFARDIYKTESGDEETGLSANLWIMIQGRPETSISIRVHRGQEVLFMDNLFHILRVEMDTIGGFVEFEIAMNGQAETPVKKGE
jgi:hypothetical protein